MFDPLNPPQDVNKEHNARHRTIRALFKRVFLTRDGQELLREIKSKTVDRPVEPSWEPETPDQQYAWHKHRDFRRGQNDIVKQIIREVEAEVTEETEIRDDSEDRTQDD